MKVNWNNKPAKGIELQCTTDGVWSSEPNKFEEWWASAAFIPPKLSALREVGKELTAAKCGSYFFTSDLTIGSPRHETVFADHGNIAGGNNLARFRALIANTCIGWTGTFQEDGTWKRGAIDSAAFYEEVPINDGTVIQYASSGWPWRYYIAIVKSGETSPFFFGRGHHPANAKWREHVTSFIAWAKSGDPHGIIDWSSAERFIEESQAVEVKYTPVPEPAAPAAEPVVEQQVLGSWVVGHDFSVEPYAGTNKLRWAGPSFPLPDGTFLFCAPGAKGLCLVTHCTKMNNRLTESGCREGVSNVYVSALLVWDKFLGRDPARFPAYPL